ncbi:hypothetical protein EJ08DRAFT_22685 [Tothia fuscella]|uniref:Uncharacterized protein n=1 Tax=Tothia fuscella TaxID=1048955 RepID=A0A9P4U2J3_9PEZI|nr:hypothetical protein EJ08DRAFT_22685 [Tothia fuscella]
MDSESFGVRLFMACIGLGIRFYWSAIDFFNRRVSIYSNLTTPRGAKAENSILVSSRAHALTSILSKDVLRSPLGGINSFTTLLAEVLIVTLAGVPFSKSSSYTAFNASVDISIAIIGIMLIVLPAVVLHLRKARKGPNPPDCIADTINMLSGSALVERLQGHSSLDTRERYKLIQGWGSMYAVRRRAANDKSSGREWSIDTS